MSTMGQFSLGTFQLMCNAPLPQTLILVQASIQNGKSFILQSTTNTMNFDTMRNTHFKMIVFGCIFGIIQVGICIYCIETIINHAAMITNIYSFSVGIIPVIICVSNSYARPDCSGESSHTKKFTLESEICDVKLLCLS